jgi:hypothetical protein
MKVHEIIVRESTTAPTGRSAQILAAIDKFASTTPISKQAITLRMEKAIGAYLKFINLLNLGIFAYQYWQDRMIIDEMVKQGQLKPADKEPAMRLIAERMVVQMMAAGAILRVITWFFRIWFVGKIATVVAGTAASIFTGGLFSPASIALLLAQEAAALYLQRWLATDDGKECVAYIVLNVIDPGVDFLWDLGPGTFVGHLKQLSPEGEKALDKKGAFGTGTVADKAANALGLSTTPDGKEKDPSATTPTGDKSKIDNTSATVVDKTPWTKLAFYLPGQDAKDAKKTATAESVHRTRLKTTR